MAPSHGSSLCSANRLSICSVSLCKHRTAPFCCLRPTSPGPHSPGHAVPVDDPWDCPRTEGKHKEGAQPDGPPFSFRKGEGHQTPGCVLCLGLTLSPSLWLCFSFCLKTKQQKTFSVHQGSKFSWPSVWLKYHVEL